MAFMRVSQKTLYSHHLNNMNTSLASLMELNIKAASQKDINRPSDNPAGTAQVMSYRHQLTQLEQYRENVDTARGWLGLQDNTLMQVNTVLTRVKELAEQAASGTYDKSNREQIGFEVREQFEQLIQLANTEFEGKHIFSGHKTEKAAFTYGLAVTSNDPLLSNAAFSISGASESTTLVQFLSSGAVGVNTLDYRYSIDGGDTWATDTLTPPDRQLNLGGVRVDMASGASVTAVDTTVQDTSENNGTWLWVRPTAVYQGDDKDVIEVDSFGGTGVVRGNAQGFFQQDIMVRIDNTSAVTLDQQIEYSYSLDKGITWVTGNTVSNAATPGSASLLIPGGYLDLLSNGGNTLAAGQQFIVRPRRADISFEISPGERITVNGVGKDIFGGVYREPYASNASTPYGGDQRNMFEVVGRLVGYIETNNQSGVQEALEELRGASEHVMTQAARVGGRENRLETADNILSSLEINKKERKSAIEDADVSELMTQIAQQQIIYEAVLKTSSQVMRMSLINYI